MRILPKVVFATICLSFMPEGRNLSLVQSTCLYHILVTIRMVHKVTSNNILKKKAYLKGKFFGVLWSKKKNSRFGARFYK